MFTIVVFNVLIAILSDSWNHLVAHDQIDDNSTIIQMLSEILEMRVFLRKVFRCFKRKKNEIENLKDMGFIYYVFRKKEKKLNDKEYKEGLIKDFKSIKKNIDKYIGNVENIQDCANEKHNLFFNDIEALLQFKDDTEAFKVLSTFGKLLEGNKALGLEKYKNVFNNTGNTLLGSISEDVELKYQGHKKMDILQDVTPRLQIFEKLFENVNSFQEDHANSHKQIQLFQKKNFSKISENLNEFEKLFDVEVQDSQEKQVKFDDSERLLRKQKEEEDRDLSHIESFGQLKVKIGSKDNRSSDISMRDSFLDKESAKDESLEE